MHMKTKQIFSVHAFKNNTKNKMINEMLFIFLNGKWLNVYQ